MRESRMMRRLIGIAGVMTLVLVAGFAPTQAQERDDAIDDAVAAAMASLDEYMTAFNSRDSKAWAATLNYPHVRLASGEVRVWETAEEFAETMDFDAFAKRYGWDHSHWTRREVVGASEGKVHIMTTFQRFNADNEPIATYDSLYVVTRVDGHWGTQARSSTAP